LRIAEGLMLHILGLIGKGIGIALLIILLLAVLLLLTVLFVPIRYRLAGRKDETGGPEGEVKLYWLFHIVSGIASWRGSLHYRIRIFGIPVYDNLKKEQKEKKKKEKKKKEKHRKKKKEKKKAAETAEEKAPVKRESPQDSCPEIRPVSRTAEDETKGTEAGEKDGLLRRIGQKLSTFWQKLLQFGRMLLNLLERLAGLPDEIGERIEGLREKAEDIRNFLERDEWKRALLLCKKQLLRVWKSIRPRTVKADVHFGFADPSTTGQVLAFAGMLYPFLGKAIVLRPDFEEQVLEGKILIVGRVTIFVLLKVLWILYFNKDIKWLIRIWKKEETLHGR